VGTRLLIRDAEHILTMAGPRPSGPGHPVSDFGPGDVLIEGSAVVDLVPRSSADRPRADNVDRVIDATGKVVLPGLINTHHHFFQALTRNLPVSQMDTLFQWLLNHYAVWDHVRAEMIEAASRVVMAELLLSGCTCTTDHQYLFPIAARGANGPIDRQVRAARDLGIRFHPTRGSMELGQSRGGLPPDRLVEDRDDVLRDSRRVVEAFHDPGPFSMCRVALAPCAPFNVSEDLLRDTAALARELGVRLHTHLAETADEIDYCQRSFGCRPVEYMRRLGWIASDVWLAHAVHLSDDEVGELAREGVAVAHCPSSNLRLGSGVAPVRRLLDAGVAVGIGVDGSASNDSSNALGELHHCLLAHRVKPPHEWLSAHEILWMATRGGAAVLGRSDVGQLASGMAADLLVVDFDQACYAGSKSDVAAALVFNEPLRPVDTVVVNGQVVVSEGRLVTADEKELARAVHAWTNELVRTATRGTPKA
jgi:cytosine/adenosine deaminase-related metal-dependent hydrolase